MKIYENERAIVLKLLDSLDGRVTITSDMWTSTNQNDRLYNVLTDYLMDCNIEIKLSTITLDNCTTNDAMIYKIKDKLYLGSLLRDGSLLHMYCCTHILNLIVKDVLEVDSVAYWTTTPKRKEKFEETTKQLRIPYTKNLALDCPIRWNSTYKMLEVAIGYEDSLNILVCQELYGEMMGSSVTNLEE
ncbi:Zinc finger BED domain-containing protein RICESLEEPER 2 [Glycine soja]